MATNRLTKEERIVKIIKKQSFTEKDHKNVVLEAQLLQQLTGEENVVRYREFFHDEKNAFIIMDFCRGGSLLDLLLSLEHFTEAQAKNLFFYVLQSLNSLHSKNIIHRDVRLENFLFGKQTQDPDSLKLIDFSSACLLKKGEKIEFPIGMVILN